jgi:hypothetical protein
MPDDIPGIDWSTAEVDDGRLTVEVRGRRSSAWTERLERHFLETAVLQANADAPPKAPKASGERSDADQAMTDVFRSFAD